MYPILAIALFLFDFLSDEFRMFFLVFFRYDSFFFCFFMRHLFAQVMHGVVEMIVHWDMARVAKRQ